MDEPESAAKPTGKLLKQVIRARFCARESQMRGSDGTQRTGRAAMRGPSQNSPDRRITRLPALGGPPLLGGAPPHSGDQDRLHTVAMMLGGNGFVDLAEAELLDQLVKWQMACLEVFDQFRDEFIRV